VARFDPLPVSTNPTHHTVVDPRFAYIIPDNQMAQGSTIGAPRCCMVIKPTGAIQKIFSPDAGLDFLGALQVHYWDRRSGIRLTPLSGEFHIHPERQDHVYLLDNGVHVHDQLFAYNDRWEGDDVPPPAVYFRVRLHNTTTEAVSLDAYGFAQLRGNTSHDVLAEYDPELNGIVAWNRDAPNHLRLFASLHGVAGWEVNDDPGKALSRISPGTLSNSVQAQDEPIGVLAAAVDLEPGARCWLEFLCVLSTSSREDLTAARRRCPAGADASAQTTQYYWSYLQRSVLRTPDLNVNHGVLWAKANMLRVQTYAPTGWCFTNDPTRSNNSVGRDTAWMAFGADYVNHHFSRECLDAYFRLQQPCGKIVEYYDVRNDESDDYGLNVNDDTPLVVIALWHHFAATRNEAHLRKRYPNAVAAMDYMLSQRNEDGLIWCTSTREMEWGIVGWRNVIDNYRISGASTEVNSECYAALLSVAEMARVLGDSSACSKYLTEARALKDAINTHLVNPENDLYLLTIDVDGTKRTEVTADLVFPVLFGVAPPARAARIVAALSNDAFWTGAGIRTVPRDALSYGPVHGFGLLGGVWVAVTYWFAFAAAKYEPGVMADALSLAFRHFSIDPRRNNTVPGQFAEWLHGEILTNQGMMLSPWDAPRYLWAAIEGAGGLHIVGTEPRIEPSLAADWRWLAAVNVPFRDGFIAWIACRMPDGTHLHTTSELKSNFETTRYASDITASARVADPAVTLVALSGDSRKLLFVGNSTARTLITAASLDALDTESCAVRLFSTISNEWEDLGRLGKQAISDGIAIIASGGGFVLLEFSP
jgi:hypothetical protein